jgi:multiple sugar transport system ATP-binding protein
VAGFIGSPSMNFFDVARDGETLVHEAFDYDLSAETQDALDGASSELTIGIRPEHISLADRSEPNAVATEIEVVEPMGEVTYAYFTIGGETYTASIDGEHRIEAGDDVNVLFPERKIHLFDGETGEAVKNSELDETAPTPEA